MLCTTIQDLGVFYWYLTVKVQEVAVNTQGSVWAAFLPRVTFADFLQYTKKTENQTPQK